MFTRAIVRKPSRSIIHGLSEAGLGLPDYNNALTQFENYTGALEACGLDVTVLDATEEFPDSVFIEDVALCTPEVAIITRPGALSRRGETNGIREVLKSWYKHIRSITQPGTLEAGDVMMVGSHYYIGLSERTNSSGAGQLKSILEEFGMSATVLELKKVLHLKTGLAYLENNKLLASGEFIDSPVFQDFTIIEIDESEAYAANSIWVNGRVIIPESYPATKKKIEAAGYSCIEVNVSEFRKLDGGLSCLSLRF